MSIGAARDDAEALDCKRVGQNLRIRDDLAGVVAEIGLHRFLKAHCLGRDNVYQWPALHAGKNCLVDCRCVLLVAQNHSGARTAQSLMGSRGHDLRVRYRRRMHASRHQSREMRHVHEIQCADFVSDLPHARKIDDPRICAATADDQLGALLLRQLLQIIIVNRLGFSGHAVGNNAVGLAGKIQMMPMSEMAAMRQVQAENGIAWLQNRSVGRHVGLGSSVRLHIGMLGAE